MKTSFAYLGFAAALAVAAPAAADTVIVANDDAPARGGFILGATIDGGHMGCQTEDGDDCGDGVHEAGGFSVHVGGLVTPRLALLAEFWGMAHSEDRFTATQVLATANVRGWIAPRLWLQGGVGVARSKLEFDGDIIMATSTSSVVPAASAAIGFELVQTPVFGLDIELRAGSGLYRDDIRIYNAALGVGASFY